MQIWSRNPRNSTGSNPAYSTEWAGPSPGFRESEPNLRFRWWIHFGQLFAYSVKFLHVLSTSRTSSNSERGPGKTVSSNSAIWRRPHSCFDFSLDFDRMFGQLTECEKMTECADDAKSWSQVDCVLKPEYERDQWSLCISRLTISLGGSTLTTKNLAGNVFCQNGVLGRPIPQTPRPNRPIWS